MVKHEWPLKEPTWIIAIGLMHPPIYKAALYHGLEELVWDKPWRKTKKEAIADIPDDGKPRITE